ncbi:hypothetical protein S83_017286 [Arachis hypogaea]
MVILPTEWVFAGIYSLESKFGEHFLSTGDGNGYPSPSSSPLPLLRAMPHDINYNSTPTTPLQQNASAPRCLCSMTKPQICDVDDNCSPTLPLLNGDDDDSAP